MANPWEEFQPSVPTPQPIEPWKAFSTPEPSKSASPPTNTEAEEARQAAATRLSEGMRPTTSDRRTRSPTTVIPEMMATQLLFSPFLAVADGAKLMEEFAKGETTATDPQTIGRSFNAAMLSMGNTSVRPMPPNWLGGVTGIWGHPESSNVVQAFNKVEEVGGEAFLNRSGIPTAVPAETVVPHTIRPIEFTGPNPISMEQVPFRDNGSIQPMEASRPREGTSPRGVAVERQVLPPEVAAELAENADSIFNYRIFNNGEYVADAEFSTMFQRPGVVTLHFLGKTEEGQHIFEGPNTVGPRVMRQALRLFQQLHPDIWRFEAQRVTGARHGPASANVWQGDFRRSNMSLDLRNPTRSESAFTGNSLVDRVIASAEVRRNIDFPIIDRTRDVPYMAGASVALDDPTIYIDRHVPTEMTVARRVGRGGTVTFDPADPWVVHENVEQHAMDILIKGGMEPEAAYRVAHHEYAERAEKAWYDTHDIDQVDAEAKQAEWLPAIQHENPENPPPNLYTKPYAHGHVEGASHEEVEVTDPSLEEIEQGNTIMEAATSPRIEGGTADHVNVPVATDLGVIGPERPSIDEGTPETISSSIVPPSEHPSGEGRTSGREGLPAGGVPDPDGWWARFDSFVERLRTSNDVRNLLREAARTNDAFPAARQGDIPLSQVEAVAEAAGVPSASVNPRGLGRLLRNDDEVRVALRLMLETTDSVHDLAVELATADTPENLIKFQAAVMRRDLAVEQVVGLRAEWGRTGNTIQEFMNDVKDAEGLTTFLSEYGRSPEDLRTIARTIRSMPRSTVASLLHASRTKGFFDNLFWYWQQVLISGWITHGKYAIANGLYSLYENTVIPPIAATLGKVKQLAGRDVDRVYASEVAARTYGIVAGFPQAIAGAARAIVSGQRVPLPGEAIVTATNPFGGGRIAPRTVPGRILGAPGDMANAIHTTFRFLGYRANLEARAWRSTLDEGIGLADAAFWPRREWHASNPTPEVRQESFDFGSDITFMSRLGPKGAQLSAAIQNTPLRWILPFTHVSANLLKRGIENSLLAPLSSEAREALLGNVERNPDGSMSKIGSIAQDTAIAHVVAGSALAAWVVSETLNGRMTGPGPHDPKDKAIWIEQGNQPWSMRSGDWWTSYHQFGPVGDIMGIGATLGEIAPEVRDEDYTKAAEHMVRAASQLMLNELGFESISRVVEALNDSNRRGAGYLSGTVGSFKPFSSAVSQTAAAMDPNMRIAKTFVDGLKYQLPGKFYGFGRETLLPVRDWAGEPIANPAYGTMLRERQVNTDPVVREFATLGIRPAPPRDEISVPNIGTVVKLPPMFYDKYQVLAGSYLKTMLEAAVQQPGWTELPVYTRQMVFQRIMETTRKTAADTLLLAYPQLVQQGVENRYNQITGNKPTKLQGDLPRE